MSQPRPMLTVRVSVPSRTSRQAVYDVLADVSTHLTWAGTESPRSDFRLLSIEAPERPAVAGDRFSSTGANNNGIFHDRSLVIEAEPGERFGFDTESTLDRRHGETWHAHIAHRYAMADADDGVAISYTFEVRPQNYVPYWLRPPMRPMTHLVLKRFMRRNLENLARMAEAVRTERSAG